MSTTSREFSKSPPVRSSAIGGSTGVLPVPDSPGASTLTLRIVRGPLAPHQSESIISQYNSLASAAISTRDFLRWIQDAPEGPAWHAILEAKDDEIVGHTSLIPIRASLDGRSVVAAKSEYSFIREEYRASKIKGFEQAGRLKNLIYIDELFRRCRSEGWGPLLISTSSSFHRVFRSIGCYPVDFPLWECLLVLRPLEAGRRTPNLRRWQRTSLWATGLAQRALWDPALLFLPAAKGLHGIPVAGKPMQQPGQGLSFFQDRDSLAWRYPQGQYERINSGVEGGADLIVKYGSASRYLRVCQWRLGARSPKPAVITRLVQMAREQEALGVRWAVYGETAESSALVKRLRKLGFLCARRTRTLLVNAPSQQSLDARTWNLTDAMFSFDL